MKWPKIFKDKKKVEEVEVKEQIVSLPRWATLTNRPGLIPLIDVDSDGAYTAMLALLKVDLPDRYWLEVAYQFIKLELQTAMRCFRFELHLQDPTKKWAQKKYPEGRGARAATYGKEARKHYIRIRGALPH